MLKTLTWFLALSLLFPPSGWAGNDSSWKKPYRTNFKSPEHYTSLERLQQREKDLERWLQRNKPVTHSPPKDLAPKVKPPEKIKIPEPPKPKFNKLESPKPALPKSKITVEKKMIDGRMHYIKTIERFDKFGNFTRRDVIDRVKLDKKTTLTTIKSYSPNGDLIRQVEKLKIRTKGGYQNQKYVSTQFDSSGNPLNRLLVKNDFKRTGFFNSTFGKVLGFALVAAGAVVAPYAFASLAGVATSSLSLGTVALTSSIGSAFAQFGVSLAQGHSVGKALLSAGITAAATFATAGLAQFLGPKGIGPILDKLGPLGKPLQIFGNNLGRGLDFVKSAGLEKTLQFGAFASKVLQGTALRVGSQQFETALSKRLGAFGTAAVLSFTTGLAGVAVSPASANPFTPEAIASAGIRALAQGGIADAFRNHRSVGAQFLREAASLSIAGLDLNVVDKTARGLLAISKTGLGQANRIFTDGAGQVIAFFNHPSNPNKQIAAFSTGQKLEVSHTAIPVRTLGNTLSGLFFRDGKQNVFQGTQLPQAITVTNLAAGHLASGKTTPMTERMVGQEIVGIYDTTTHNSFQLTGSTSSPLVRGIFESKTFRGLKEFAVSQIQRGSPTRVISSLVVDFVPGPGTWKGIQEAATGRDLISGEKLNLFGRVLSGVGAIPFFGGAVKNGSKIIRAVSKVAKESKIETEIVQRAMSRAELEATKETGLLRGGREGIHHVSDNISSDLKRARQRLGLITEPEVKVTLEVPGGIFSPPIKVRPVEHPNGGILPGGGTERKASGIIPVRVLKVKKYKNE